MEEGMVVSRIWLLLLLLPLFLASCEDSDQPETAAATATLPLPAPTEPVNRQMPAEEVTDVVPSTGSRPTPTNVPASPTASTRANADVTFVRAVQEADNTWTFHVTVTHPDTGWEDYADGWDVVTPAGAVLTQNEEDTFTRVLLHPHVNEQPFTRSQRGLVVPEGVEQVTVRAHDLVAGFGGKMVTVDLTGSSGPDFEVERRQE